MSQALLAGDEPVAVRAHDAAVFERDTVEHLEDVAGDVLERDQFDDATIGQLFGGALLERHSGGGQVVPDLLKLGGGGGLPAGDEQAVLLTGHDHQASREVVHPQVQRVGGVRALALDHAEHLEAVVAPGRHVGGLDTHVAQGPDAHHLPPSSRKSVASRLNSSNFSSCAQ